MPQTNSSKNNLVQSRSEDPATISDGESATIVNGFWSLTIITKLSIIDACNDPGYASGAINRSSQLRCSVKKDGLKNFAIFTGNHLCCSLL